MKLIECVPNISEGRDKKSIDFIKDSVARTNDVKLLNCESDEDYNRTVFTLVGGDRSIINGAINLSVAASKVIDMKIQKGAHPRIGAVDVVPFIPVRNSSIEECIEISKEFGSKISKIMNIPVYLYEYSASVPLRKNLSEIRKGEYENLSRKLLQKEWKPDFGKANFNEKLGALVTGARPFLIAFNVNLMTEDISAAKKIAETIRESGVTKKDIKGNVVMENGAAVRMPGRLKDLKAIGVSLAKHSFTQISMNLTNYKSTSLHTAYEEIKKEAEKLNVKIGGSEIIGLVPLEAMLQSGLVYNNNKPASEDILIDLAIERMGLNSFRTFIKKEKIIDYLI